jgi:hypothetical protein
MMRRGIASGRAAHGSDWGGGFAFEPGRSDDLVKIVFDRQTLRLDQGDTPVMPMRERSSDEAYRGLREAPDTALIAGAAREDFNEGANMGAVLDEVPGQIAHVPVSLLVIDGGGTDGTSAVAHWHGALVCTLSGDRRQGVPLQLGSRADPADLPAMARFLAEENADFVVGSRQLGRTENAHRLRNIGVRFFAWLISRLAGTRPTDTSSGLRMVRAEMTGVVRQRQLQYHTPEPLIGGIFQGFRDAEVPTAMRQRISGTGKKVAGESSTGCGARGSSRRSGGGSGARPCPAAGPRQRRGGRGRG